MPFTPDILYILAGAFVGLVCGFTITRLAYGKYISDNEKLTGQVQELLQEKTRAETELEKERESFANQKELIEGTRARMSEEFKSLSIEALTVSSDNLLKLAHERFLQIQTSAQANLKETVSPVSISLQKIDEKIASLEKERQTAYGSLTEHLRAMKLDQERLRGETTSLVQALRSPSTRGQWGEMQLKRTLDMAGLTEGIHYRTQVVIDNQRPDVVVYLAGGKSIVVDSKAPIEAYLDSIKDGITESDRITALDRHARHVREHIRSLGTKAYWEKFDTPEFVVMFLPGESYYSAALERDSSLLEFGVDQKVIPASPTTLISLLKAVVYGWQQEKLTENAREISELGRDLYKRLSSYGEHMQKIGKGLGNALKSYNDAVGSLERSVLPCARKFQERQQLSVSEEIPAPEQLEHTVRQLTASELLEHQEEDSNTVVTPLKTA